MYRILATLVAAVALAACGSTTTRTVTEQRAAVTVTSESDSGTVNQLPPSQDSPDPATVDAIPAAPTYQTVTVTCDWFRDNYMSLPRTGTNAMAFSDCAVTHYPAPAYTVDVEIPSG